MANLVLRGRYWEVARRRQGVIRCEVRVRLQILIRSGLIDTSPSHVHLGSRRVHLPPRLESLLIALLPLRGHLLAVTMALTGAKPAIWAGAPESRRIHRVDQRLSQPNGVTNVHRVAIRTARRRCVRQRRRIIQIVRQHLMHNPIRRGQLRPHLCFMWRLIP